MIVAVTPEHTVADTRQILRMALQHESEDAGVFLGLLAGSSEEVTARAEQVLMRVSRDLGLAPERVAVLPAVSHEDSKPPGS